VARRAAVAPYPEEQIQLLMRLGALREDRLGDAERAIAAFREVLGVNEQHREALDHLARLLEFLERYEDLIPVYQAKADFSTDPAERVSFYRQVAELTEQRLGNAEGAIGKWEDVLVFAPEDVTALDNLIRLYEGLGKWGEMVEVCRRAAAASQAGADRRVALWQQIARTAERHLDEAQTAEEFWVRVREAEPRHQEARSSLRRLYRINENFAALAVLLEEMASEAPAEPGEAPPIELWTELARLRTGEYPDPAAAIAAWQQVAALSPSSREALDALETLFQETGRWQDCIDIQRRKLALVEPGERIAVLTGVAEILETYLQDWNGAVSARREILELEPGNLSHFRTLEDLLESQGRWADLAELQTRKCDLLEPPARLETLRGVASIYENQLRDQEGAFLLFQRALQEKPTDAEALEGIERVALGAGLHGELREAWEASVQAFDEPLERIALLRKLALLDRDTLGRPGDAVSWLEQIRALDPDDEEALKALVELYQALERWPELAAALEKLAGLTTDFREQTTIFLRLGDCLKDRLRQPERAVAAYREVLEMDPTEERAVQALETLYEQIGNWAALVDVLSMRASIHPEQETAIRLLRGLIFEERLGDNGRAAEEYEEVLAFEPANSEAIGRLKRIYSESGNWSRLSDTLERSLTLTRDPGERAELLASLALLQEEALENLGEAAGYYQQILDLQPDHLGAITALERIYRHEERHDDLVLVLRRHAELSEEIGRRVDLLEQAATLYIKDIGDQDSAIAVCREILDLDPAHRATLDRLEGLYKERGAWDQVLEILDRKIRLSRSEEEILDLYLRKGAIYREELYLPDRAKEQYVFALERSRGALRAADQLVAMYADEEAWESAVAVLTAVARAQATDEERAPVQVRIGEICMQRLAQPEQAIEMYEAALDGVPGMPEAMEPLVEIYISMERWAKVMALLQLMRQRVEGSGDRKRLVDILYKTGHAAQQMGDSLEALRQYRTAYDRDPAHVPTLTGLATLNQHLGKFEEAETYFRSLLNVAGTRMDEAQKISVYRALGEVEMQLGRPKLAEEYLAQVIELQPSDRTCLEDLARLMEMYQDWEGVIRYREKLLDLVDDPLERLTIQLGIGDVYRGKL
ncbi:MAG: tetratricopeptide repeat protein, partial [Deltaproteobacteria bacterium]|nr:tetratricopeptide repeat protein [Deltaproteobacteria bacterium]